MHRIGELERFDAGKYFRVVTHAGKVGEISVTNDPENSQLIVEIDFPDTSATGSIIARVRSMFDLDLDPLLIANRLETDPSIAVLLRKYPGIRLPSGWDGFEIGVATILGQLVSVERARALVADLIELAGADSGLFRDGKSIKLFPTPSCLAKADLTALKSTGARKRSLGLFAERVASGELSLETTQEVEPFRAQLLAIPGIGPWTVNYLTLKILRHPDSFPGTDLILARALERHPQNVVDAMSPWRGYVAALFWREYAGFLKKTKPLKIAKKKK